MKTAVFCGDRWHPAEVVQEGLDPLRTTDTTLEFFTDAGGWTWERMQLYDVLILSKGNGRTGSPDRDWLTEELQDHFQRYVEAGGGLLVCHSGTVGYRDQPGFRRLIGGVFSYHPQPCPIILEYTGSFGRAENDPKIIRVHDEHYFVETGHDIDVFLKSSSESGTQPAGWTRREGRGRVCVLTPGHFADVWLHPVYQHTLAETLRWCGAGRTGSDRGIS
jgi:type 1 glutamine amidotransferase